MNSKRAKIWWDFVKEQDKNSKRPKYAFNEELPLLDIYPQNIPDNPLYTLFGNNTQNPEICNAKVLPPLLQLRQMIRATGRTLLFPDLNIHVRGVQDNTIFANI
jgi:hypothetical protein